MGEPLVLYSNNKLTALEPETGAVRWALALPGAGTAPRMVVRHGVVVVAGYELIACVDQNAGQLLWRVPGRRAARIGVLIREGRVFVYTNGTVTAYDGRGNQLWCREELNHYAASMGFTDDICWIPDTGA